LIYTHMHTEPLWYLIGITILLQVGIFSRMISASALMSGLPAAADRGSYMSITSSLQQVAGGIAAVVAGHIVIELPSGVLMHFDTVGYVLVVTTLISLSLIYLIDRKLNGPPKPTTAGAQPAPL
jgi:hypothetical protein